MSGLTIGDCRILHPIELPLIPKPIGDGKWHNYRVMMKARAHHNYNRSGARVDVDLNSGLNELLQMCPV